MTKHHAPDEPVRLRAERAPRGSVRPATRRTATRRHLRQPERSHNGGSISAGTIDHLIGQKPVDPAAAAALRTLHDEHGLRIILACSTLPCETRWPALQQAGIDHLFCVALLSYQLGVRKPELLFYRLAAAAEAAPEQVMFVGDNLAYDVAAPMTHGMRAAPVRPHGLGPGEEVPDGALLIRHVNELPGLLEDL